MAKNIDDNSIEEARKHLKIYVFGIIALLIFMLFTVTIMEHFTKPYEGIVIEKYIKNEIDFSTSMAGGGSVEEKNCYVKVRIDGEEWDVKVRDINEFDKIKINDVYKFKAIKL